MRVPLYDELRNKGLPNVYFSHGEQADLVISFSLSLSYNVECFQIRITAVIDESGLISIVSRIYTEREKVVIHGVLHFHL